MATEKELMLKQADAETTYQKKLTAGTNITIDPVTNIISSAGGGSTVQYTDNTPNGESVGILAINGQSHPVRIPKLAEGSGITISKNITTNVYTISLSGGGGGTTKTYMGENDPDELVGEDGDLYFKYHKITTVIPTELTLPSLPDNATVPFPITNFNSYDSFTFYCTDPSLQTTTINLNIGDIPIGDNPAELTPKSEIHRFNTFYYAQVSRSTDGKGLVFRVGRNVLFKLEANVTEVDLGIDKSYAKVKDTWLPSGEQIEANPEETSQTPLTKIKIDGVTYYIAAGGSAEIVPLTKAKWDALPASKYTDNILYLITDSFTTETIITPNPEGEATDTLTKLQINETIYDFAGGSGSGGGVKKDLLWEYTDSYNITLSSPLTDYDFLIFEGDNYRDTHHKGGAIVSSNLLDSIAGVSGKVYTFNGAIGEFANYNVVSDTSLTYKEGNARALKVWGIKYNAGGSSGGGEGYTETLLYQPQTAFGTGVITLSNDISNYDALIFRTKFKDGTRSESIVTSSEIEKVGYIATPSISSEHVLIKAYSGNYFRVVRGSETDDKVLNFFHVSGDELIYEIYGVKFGSGSSSSGSSVHYSTTEQVIGTWLNNKPLYQKTYENLNIGTDKNYSLTLSDLQNIEYLRVVPEGSQVSAIVPFPYVHYNSNNDISYFIDSITDGVPTLAIRKGSEMSSQSNLQFLTIQYTKTTD